MTSAKTKWDRASRSYDWMTWAEVRRFGDAKRRMFARMTGRCFMVAAGTGADFQFFPAGLTVTAIDLSPKMVERARKKAWRYDGVLDVRLMDVTTLEFPDASFDTAVTSFTFCSVPDPIAGLCEVYRCLKPDGRLLMFEHVRSRIGPIAIAQDLMTPFSRRFGPDMNRDTVRNVVSAGFRVLREENAYLDIVKAIEAVKENAADRRACARNFEAGAGGR